MVTVVEREIGLLVEANNDGDETKPSVGRTKDVRAARQVKAVVGLSRSCISVELIKAVPSGGVAERWAEWRSKIYGDWRWWTEERPFQSMVSQNILEC